MRVERIEGGRPRAEVRRPATGRRPAELHPGGEPREQLGIGEGRRTRRSPATPFSCSIRATSSRHRGVVERARAGPRGMVVGGEREERLHRAGEPRLAEDGAPERRGERAVVQVRAVAHGATLLVCGEARVGLLRGVAGRLAPLLRLLLLARERRRGGREHDECAEPDGRNPGAAGGVRRAGA